ncbi:hypothetical protein Tco_1136271 [Tanacetum coccineum]
MSTSKTYQQSLADAGSETRPPMLERGSYIPWASRFRRYINRKRENQKWLNKALDEGDALLHYDAEMELMNLILLSILNDIYNSVDACTSAKDMWKRVKRLMRGTIQNKVDRETRFTNEFDQFVAKPGEALVSVYNRFAQLMNDLERNDMHFPIVTINTKFLNSLQPEWLKYVTQVRFAKRLTVDTFDDLFYYLQQFEKLVNVSRANKLEKSHDPLALVAHTGSSSRNTSSYYVTHPTSMVDYEDEYQQDDVHTILKPQNLQCCDMVNIQSKNSGNARINNRRAYVQEEIETLQLFNATTAMEKDIMLGIVQSQESGTRNTSWNKCCWQNRGQAIDSAFISGEYNLIQHWKMKNNEFNSGSIEKDTHVPDLCALERLARNAYQEAEKQQIFAQKVQKQNTTLTSQLELYKERVRILENINGDNNYLNEFLEADKRAKHFSQQAQSQFDHDRDINRDLEKQRDKLDLDVKDYKRQNEELQKTHSILKRQMSENEDKYHGTVLDLEAKQKKNVDLILKLGNSLQGMFMLGPKPLSMYHQQIKHGFVLG